MAHQLKTTALRRSTFRSRLPWSGFLVVLLPLVCQAADGPVEGFGNDMPLVIVAGQIVPNGVAVDFGPRVRPDTSVSWRGGPSWQTALREALAPVGLTPVFEDRHVLVEAPALPPPPPWRRPDRWEARAGDNLSDVARAWGARIGVPVVIHGTHQYPIEAPVTFDGDFQDALSHLVEAFSTAKPRPLLDIWNEGENYTVELTEGSAQ